MRTLIADFTLSLLITCLLWAFAGAVLADQEPQILYDPYPNSNRPNINKPRIYIDRQGKAWETYRGTYRPDRSKPLPSRPKPQEPIQPRRLEQWGDWHDQ